MTPDDIARKEREGWDNLPLQLRRMAKHLYGHECSVAMKSAETIDALVEDNERLRKGLRTLVGYCEIAAVAPKAIGKTLVMAIDGPELTEARAALSKPTPDGGKT